MESNEELEQQRREAERAAAAPHVDSPPYPAWVPLPVGLFAAGMVVLHHLRTADSRLVSLLLLVLVMMPIAAFAWDRKRRGVWPRGAPPREFRVVFWTLIVAALGLVIAIQPLYEATSVWIATPIVFAVAAAGMWWFLRAHRRAAQKVRERLK